MHFTDSLSFVFVSHGEAFEIGIAGPNAFFRCPNARKLQVLGLFRRYSVTQNIILGPLTCWKLDVADFVASLIGLADPWGLADL